MILVFCVLYYSSIFSVAPFKRKRSQQRQDWSLSCNFPELLLKSLQKMYPIIKQNTYAINNMFSLFIEYYYKVLKSYVRYTYNRVTVTQ